MLIFEARENGLSFCELDETDMRYAIDQIMFKGAAIFGCALPNTEMFAKYISDEIRDYILEFGYGELTVSEIILAFKMNIGSEIKNPLGDNLKCVEFYGNSINVSFIGKVLSNYMIIRNNLDTRIKNQIDGY